MATYYISIGIDCDVALTILKLGFREMSLPFDWVVPYSGVYDIIKNNFEGYLPVEPYYTKNISKKSNSLFIHNDFPKDIEQMERRFKRFNELLTSENELVFIRKAHSLHHHDEVKVYNCDLKDDLIDCEDLYDYFKETYPKLKFRIELILTCSECHSKIITSDKINITDYDDSILIKNKIQKITNINV